MNIKSIISKVVPQVIKQKINAIKQENILMKGYQIFLETGQTPPESYMAIINLYCSTKGKFNETFHNKIKSKYPPLKISTDLTGTIGTFTSTDFNNTNLILNKNGYIHFDKKLSAETVKKIYDFALKTPATIPPSYDKKTVYDPANPLAEIYRFDQQVLMNNTDIQDLIMDPVLLNIARNYLECEPIFDFPAMWWSTAFQKEASAEAAQLYHFDMDRIKWLKIFFYLNDVTLENGPHSYIQGTHKPETKPDELLKRGYVRIKDEELHPYYKSDDVKIVYAKAGSIFAGDTKCWHKGINLKKGHRLVLEFEYTSSLFGTNIPKLEITNFSGDFEKFCYENKTIASNIQLKKS